VTGKTDRDSGARPGQSWAIILLLSALSMLAPLTIDIALPAFAAIERDLGMVQGTAPTTISVFLVGFALGPLLFGPLSDSFGRRPLLLLGMAVYVAAGVLCALAPTPQILLSARLMQGVGAGAGAVMPIAIVRDMLEGITARRALSMITLVAGVAPVVAPLIGAGALLISGWRMIFDGLAVAGILLILFIVMLLPESRASVGRPKFTIPRMARDYRAVLSNPGFLTFSIANAFNFACMFAYVSASPQVFIITLGVSPGGFGLIFASTAMGIVGGALLSSRLLAAGVRPARLLTFSLWGSGVCALILCAITASGYASVLSMLPLLILNNVCAGIVRPNATHEAMQPMPHIAGAASALVRGLQMIVGAGAAALVALLHGLPGPFAMTAVMLISAAVAIIADSVGQRLQLQGGHL
jgi:DHA1 family bicyclomycin/chloramphenicol resistance-like MFS transporter